MVRILKKMNIGPVLLWLKKHFETKKIVNQKRNGANVCGEDKFLVKSDRGRFEFTS